MKSLLNAVIAALLLSPFSAHAVKVSECPQVVKVQMKSLNITTSLDQINKKMDEWVPEEKVAAVQVAYANLLNSYEVYAEFPLFRAESGRCVYSDSDYGKTGAKVVVSTSKGKDQMYMQTVLGPMGVLLRTYLNVDSVVGGQIILSSHEAMLYMAVPRGPYDNYEEGGDLFFLGRTNNVQIVP